ncbi:type-1 angiotensin II receptor-associated protein-like isoform X1 [Lingula anatina]|uniref:Type-1 angiotensin II receptor-associated protein-like isoform X1 n=1 Tax=Lingula anatina TaxID=7574 RepID=A0A1S3I5V0_LINAN|nr:type-1 angiotensin II receptor-associated protein-like isoform X1 [Lingula anatina]|eukprot:XP_013393583.1 type-1 angiotensin II receptor-associated protein-like isoform X1 [Lingula anatina]
MNAPQLTLKVVVIVHFILTTWATMAEDYLPDSYYYMNMVMGVVGSMAIIFYKSIEAIHLLMVLMLFSILQDIVCLGLFEPAARAVYENASYNNWTMKNTYRFSLGMTILNLLIKPFTCFMLYRVYQERGGSMGDLNIPGLDAANFPGFGGQKGPYENIDQPVPSNNVETASPHHSIEKPQDPPGY